MMVSLTACGGTSKSSAKKTDVYAPEDMPEICQDIDFNNAGADIKKLCGVQTRNYRAYKNIPEHRNLLNPKGAKIVRKGKVFELRLVNTLPIQLPEDFEGKMQFGEKQRRTFIKVKMDYCEFFPENSSDRLRIMKLDVPLDTEGEVSICYTVESKTSTAQRKAGYAGRLEPLACSDFARLKAVSQSQSGSGGNSEEVKPEAKDKPSGSGEPSGH